MGIEELAIKVEGVWMPKGEKHLIDWMQNSKGAFRKDGMITYQMSKQAFAQDAMREHIPNWQAKTFVDVGAHVGLWSMWWAPLMKHTVAFEPIPTMAAIYRQNMQGRGEYSLFEKAVGEHPGALTLTFNPENTGNTHMTHDGDGNMDKLTVDMTTVDHTVFNLAVPIVGAMKVDCEGTELAVLKGAVRMIEHDRPLIVVEQKKGAEYYGADPLGAVKFLEAELGYKTLKVMSGDHIMVPK